MYPYELHKVIADSWQEVTVSSIVVVFLLTLCMLTPGRLQSKTPILSRKVDKKVIETVFLIAICHHTGNK